MKKFFSGMNKFLEHGLMIFVFFLLIFSTGRMIFIFVLNDYIGDVSIDEIFFAMWLGLRLSCQTAGILTLMILIAHLISNFLEKIFVTVIFISTSILYFASFPFYKQFHSNFNQMIFNAVNDDLYALFITFVEEFNLLPKLFFALILSFILYKIFFRLPTIKIHGLITIALTYLIVTLSIFGGSLNWQTELTFENIGITKDKFLNEAILDSYQAVYRAYVLQSRTDSGSGLNFSAQNIKNLASIQSQNINSNDLSDYLKKSAQGEIIPKPKHIFIIISESYANWTLLENYSDLHIADGMKSIINESDSDYCPTFLPNGASTVSAVTGIVAGLADANLYLTTLPQSFKAPYLTAAAPQIKNLGYETNFFYAGPSTWEKISDFVTAQGFENFYGEGDIYLKNIKGNVWGIDDKFLYQFVEKNLNLNVPSFNVILNTSNHSPYTVDLDEEKILLAKKFDEEDLNKKLAHQLYADRELKKFIDDMKLKSPESLFIIVGDHADRCNIDKQPSDYERFCIPFIVTGNGVHKNILNKKSAGSQIDILPTIIELIAPKNFEYFSIGKSLTENQRGVNYALFITRNSIGNANSFPLKLEPLTNEIDSEDWTAFENYINYVRGVSYWIAKFGNKLE